MLKIITTNKPLLVLQCRPGCYSRSSMSTPQLSQICGCQTVVSELTRRTTFKVQVFQCVKHMLLMYQWYTNRYYAGYDGQVIGKKDSVHTE